jgi:hypothetical protein
MAGRVDQATQTAAIARLEELASSSGEIREELTRVLQGPYFASSRRSQKFLTFVVENSLNRHFDQLKERTIGAELFARSADYDTNTDSIVRVTATDVRKRLFEHYASVGKGSRFRIELPQGSYIPEFQVQAAPAEAPPATGGTAVAAQATAAPMPAATMPAASGGRRSWLVPFSIALAMLATAAALWLATQNASLRNQLSLAPPPPRMLPWTAVFDTARRTHLVVADTSFAALQDLLQRRIPLSDYAARTYPPAGAGLPAEVSRVERLLTRNHFTSAADASLAARLAQNFGAQAAAFTVTSARNVQIRTFRSADNFILIGSSYANPWADLIAPQLGVTVEYDPVERRQIAVDKHPASGQPARFVPTARTGGSGEAYAVLALIRNPGQSGHVLLLAGTSMEGTEAAGELAFDSERLSGILSKAGINPSARPPQPFEILLRLTSMAGAASSSEIVLARPISQAR